MFTKGWKLIDANAENVSDGVVMSGSGLNSDDWIVLIATREPRISRPSLEDLDLCFKNLRKR